MLGTVDGQESLLGVDSLLSRLFEGDDDSFYARLATHGHEVIRDEDFAHCYSTTMGRPSIPPSLMMRAVLCQMRDDVSDREAARRAAKDLDWKRALGIEADVVPFHHTSFSVFRSRLLVNDADGLALAKTIERAVAAGLFAKRVLAIADSTGVMGAAAVADTYELIRAAIAKVVAAAGGPKALPSRLRTRARAAVRGKATIEGPTPPPATPSWVAWSSWPGPCWPSRSMTPPSRPGSCWPASSTKTSPTPTTVRPSARAWLATG